MRTARIAANRARASVIVPGKLEKFAARGCSRASKCALHNRADEAHLFSMDQRCFERARVRRFKNPQPTLKKSSLARRLVLHYSFVDRNHQRSPGNLIVQ
jgi:hypothetical protein